MASDAVEKDIQETLGTLMRLRMEIGLTIEQTAKSAGVSRAYLSRIENRRIRPTLSTLAKLARFFDVPLSDLAKEYRS